MENAADESQVNQFRETVKARLAELEMSESTLAKLLGWDADTLSGLLTTESPNGGQVEHVCEWLGIEAR